MNHVKLLLVGLVVGLPVVGWAAVAHAQGNFRSGGDITVAQNETVDRTLFAAGQTIDIAGEVNGDVFCAGQSVTISGSVNGDVICAGQTVQITGRVDGNVRVVGQSVTIGGTVSRNASIAGQTVTLDSSARIDGDVSIGGQNATLNGVVGRDLNAGSTLLTINGSVGRDVQSIAKSLTLGSGTVIGGDLSYVSANNLTRDSGAQVLGAISRHNPPRNNGANVGWGMIGGTLWFALYLLVSLLLVALAVILLIPQAVQTANQAAMREPWKTLLVGSLAHIIAPIAFLTLMFTIVGIPLGILALLAWFVLSCLAFPFAAYYVGNLLAGKSTHNVVWIMLLGAAIIVLLFMLPFIGFLTWVVVTWFGTGIILLQVPRLPRPRYELVKSVATKKK